MGRRSWDLPTLQFSLNASLSLSIIAFGQRDFHVFSFYSSKLNMKLFRTHQHIFRLLFIYPIESSATIQDKFLIILFGILVFFNQIFCWIGSTLFLEQYIESTKYVIMVSVQIAALSASIYILVIAVLQRQKITSLIDEIQGIFDSCE